MKNIVVLLLLGLMTVEGGYAEERVCAAIWRPCEEVLPLLTEFATSSCEAAQGVTCSKLAAISDASTATERNRSEVAKLRTQLRRLREQAQRLQRQMRGK